MRTVSAVVFLALLPAAASAQPRAFAVWERPAAGVFIGPSVNGDRTAAKPAWTSASSSIRLSCSGTGCGRMRRASRGASRNATIGRGSGQRHRDTEEHPSERPQRASRRPRMAGYAGGGYGVYRYEYAHTAAAQSLAGRFPWCRRSRERQPELSASPSTERSACTRSMGPGSRRCSRWRCSSWMPRWE